MSSRNLIVTSGLILFAASSALADFFFFKQGGSVQLPSKIEGDQVEVETPDGPRRFHKGDFETIVPTARLVEEWSRRRDLADKSGGVETRFAAAWWALENGLTDEALTDLENLRTVAQDHGPTLRSLRSIDRLTPPCPDPDLERINKQIKPFRFREARSPHAILFHQHGESEAAERLDVIERVVKTFQVAFAAQGIELPAPGFRLVSVYFAEHRDYVAFLRRVDGDTFVETQGFYHPGLKAVFAFDTRTSDRQLAGRRAITNRKVGGDSPSELNRRSLLLDLDWRETDLGILAHETVHQLTTESGLANRFDDFPTWLHEGLAAQFEVIRGGRWAGFGRVNDRRIPDWRSLHPEPRLSSLIQDAGFGRGYRRDLYAQSWALVYFLRKSHPREFSAYLDLLRTPRRDLNIRSDRTIEAFQLVFGSDLRALEAEWHRFLSGLKTPLEQARSESSAQPSKDALSSP